MAGEGREQLPEPRADDPPLKKLAYPELSLGNDEYSAITVMMTLKNVVTTRRRIGRS